MVTPQKFINKKETPKLSLEFFFSSGNWSNDFKKLKTRLDKSDVFVFEDLEYDSLRGSTFQKFSNGVAALSEIKVDNKYFNLAKAILNTKKAIYTADLLDDKEIIKLRGEGESFVKKMEKAISNKDFYNAQLHKMRALRRNFSAIHIWEEQIIMSLLSVIMKIAEYDAKSPKAFRKEVFGKKSFKVLVWLEPNHTQKFKEAMSEIQNFSGKMT